MTLSLSTHAQELNFGIKGGINYNMMSTSDDFHEFWPRVGTHAGGFIRFRYKNLALQSELLLSRVSGDRKHIDDYMFPQARFTERVNYMSFPVLVKVYFMDFIHFHVGPQFNLITQVEREPDMVFSFQAPKQNVTAEYFPWDLSAAVGAGIDLRAGLVAEIRYNHGLQNMYNVISGEERRHNLWQISIGYSFLR